MPRHAKPATLWIVIHDQRCPTATRSPAAAISQRWVTLLRHAENVNSSVRAASRVRHCATVSSKCDVTDVRKAGGILHKTPRENIEEHLAHRRSRSIDWLQPPRQSAPFRARLPSGARRGPSRVRYGQANRGRTAPAGRPARKDGSRCGRSSWVQQLESFRGGLSASHWLFVASVPICTLSQED